MPTIKGGFSTKDPNAFSKVIEASGSNIKLPFKATGFTSTKTNALADLVKEKEVKVVVDEVKQPTKKVVRRKKYGKRSK